MPELPEVENYRKYLQGTSLDQKIIKVEVDDPKLTKPDLESILDLKGLSFIDTNRIGKYLFLKLSNNEFLLMHFGLTGSVSYFRDIEDTPKYTRVLFHFNNSFKLSYICKRKFGWVERVEDVVAYQEKSGLGQDAVTIDWDAFYSKIHKKRTMIKSTLLDQKITAGIGNWIADEILYQSKIHPETRVNDLKESQIREIFDKMKRVINTALKHEADFEKFPNDFMIHNRKEGGKCYHTGKDIVRIVVGGRGTFYSPEWQK